MLDTCATENYATRDVDEISSGNDVADGLEEGRHGFARENITGEENAGENGQKSELHRFRLGIRLAGDEDPKRERGEQIGQREQREQEHAAMNGHEEKETHKEKNETELEEANAEVGEQFTEEKAEGTDRSDEELLEGTALFFADDGEGGKKRGDVEEHDGSEAGQKEICRARIGIEKKLRAHIDGKFGAVLQNAPKRFIEADGSGDVDGLTGDGGVRAVDEHEDLGAHLVEETVGIIDGDFDADTRFAGDDEIVQIVIVFDVAEDVKRVGIFQAVNELAAFAAAVGVVYSGIDLANVGINAEAEEKHLQQRHGEGKEESARIAANVKSFFVKDGAKTAKNVKHERSPAALDACRSVRRRRLRGWERADESRRRQCRFSRAGCGGRRD